MKKIEKERKWLLKCFPPELKSTLGDVIVQYYIDDYRIRATRKNDGSTIYEKIIKKNISLGVNEETILKTTSDDFSNIPLGTPVIHKKRHYLNLTDKLTLEIDVFININLIVMELENVDIDDKIIFPKFIQDYIIMEVTEFPEFSNKNLAI